MNRRKGMIIFGLLVILAVLLAISPQDIKLKLSTKAVYLHGAITWVSYIIFAVFGISGLAFLVTGKQWFFDLAARGHKVGTVFWVVNFMVWVPLSWYTWNTIFGEPRAKASVWIMLCLGIVYLISQLIAGNKLMAGIYGSLGLGIWIYGLTAMGIISGSNRLLHPLDPIKTSPSSTIKLAYAGIYLTILLIAVILVFPPRKVKNN
ncbi:MAG TPA: hypothetical protein VNU93_03440 [Verrucomicrobiae bacterium]|nr:hypothetical protein [Verrucomicrobiae bacterium]